MKTVQLQRDSTSPAASGEAVPPSSRRASVPQRAPRGRIRWQRWSSKDTASTNLAELVRSIPLSGLPPGGDDWTSRSVLVAAAGAVGGVAIEHLARAGVGTVWVVDPARYRPASFLTQPIDAARTGQPKPWVQGARAHRIQPASTIIAGLGYIEDVPWSILYAADVWLAAGDTQAVPYYLGRLAKQFGRRLIQAAVFGPTSTAIVRGYPADPRTACPLCDHDPHAEPSETAAGSCDPMLAAPAEAHPTRTQSTICAMAGTLGAHEALTALAGHDPLLLNGEELVYCLSAHRVFRSTLATSAECLAEHERADVVPWNLDWDQTTPAMLAAELGLNTAAPLPLRGELPWVTCGSCATCGAIRPVRRFGRLGDQLSRCACGGAVGALPRGLRDAVPIRDAARCWNTSLRQLGLPSDRGVALRHKDRCFYVLPPIPDQLRPTPLGGNTS